MKNSILTFVIGCIFLGSCNDVQTTTPVKSDLVDAVFASGYVILASEYQVTANTEGYLVKRFVEEGVTVTSRQPLFQLSNEVQEAQLTNAQDNYEDAVRKLEVEAPQQRQLVLQIEQAHAQLKLDETNLARYQKLLESNAVSQVEYDNAEMQVENARRNVVLQEEALQDHLNSLKLNVSNAQSQLTIQQENNADYFLSSRMDGQVLKIIKKQGELVKRGEVVALIGGGEKRARLYVSEEDINLIEVGQEVAFGLNTEKGKVLNGTVEKIYPSFDDVEQSFIVEASINANGENIYHNTQLQANIIVGEVQNALVIPAQYLLAGDSVLVKGGQVRPIHAGLRNEDWVEVVEGLDTEDVIVNPASL